MPFLCHFSAETRQKLPQTAETSTRPRKSKKGPQPNNRKPSRMEPTDGIEPTTCALRMARRALKSKDLFERVPYLCHAERAKKSQNIFDRFREKRNK